MSDAQNPSFQKAAVAQAQGLNVWGATNRASGMLQAAQPAVPFVPSTHSAMLVDIVDFTDAYGTPTTPPEDVMLTCDNAAVVAAISSDFRTVSVSVADPATVGKANITYSANNGKLNLTLQIDMIPGGAMNARFDLSNIRLIPREVAQPDLPLGDVGAGPAATA